jgi:hypothetical protein
VSSDSHVELVQKLKGLESLVRGAWSEIMRLTDEVHDLNARVTELEDKKKVSVKT